MRNHPSTLYIHPSKKNELTHTVTISYQIVNEVAGKKLSGPTIIIARALCNPKDDFSKKIGRSLSTERLSRYLETGVPDLHVFRIEHRCPVFWDHFARNIADIKVYDGHVHDRLRLLDLGSQIEQLLNDYVKDLDWFSLSKSHLNDLVSTLITKFDGINDYFWLRTNTLLSSLVSQDESLNEPSKVKGLMKRAHGGIASDENVT